MDSTTVISIIAIGISLFTLYSNFKHNKRQLRIGRIEEMLEIIHILDGHYRYFKDTEYYKSSIINDKDAFKNEKAKYVGQVNHLIDISKEIDFENKLIRLYVLNNSYLPNEELKDKIGVFITILTSLGRSTIIPPFKKYTYPFNKFPEMWEFGEFSKEIKNGLTGEMKLGYKSNIGSKNPYEEEFKTRYNLH